MSACTRIASTPLISNASRTPSQLTDNPVARLPNATYRKHVKADSLARRAPSILRAHDRSERSIDERFVWTSVRVAESLANDHRAAVAVGASADRTVRLNEARRSLMAMKAF
jgi:hypothetical protein